MIRLVSATAFSCAALALTLAAGPLHAQGPQAAPGQQTAPASGQNATDAAARVAGPADVSELVRTLTPAVVAVSTQTKDEQLEPGMPEDSPFGRFFRRCFDERGPGRRPRQGASLGSGFIIDGAGHVVTNNHVIANATEIRVVMSDRSTHIASLIGRDEATDLAVLRLDKPPAGISPVRWGDSTAGQPGSWTIAIGSQFGLGGTVTVGVLSARSRDIRAGLYDDFLQTDASINSGNSGGPLFNAQGAVIGVNTAIFSPSGGNIGLGFAIPSAIARGIVQEIIDKGRVERGYIGVSLQPMSPAIARAMGLEKARGALVASVVPGGPADRAGLQAGDVITRFEGEEVEPRNLPRQVAAKDPGSTVALEVLHAGQSRQLELTIVALPDQRSAEARSRSGSGSGGSTGEPTQRQATRLGVTLAPLDADALGRQRLQTGQDGVLVQAIEPSSPAAESGLQIGDVIVEAGNQPVSAPGDVARAWAEAQRTDRPALLRVSRDGQLVCIAVES